jgi:NAD(P)-dependent dehydrogenase (short-subunit alcohol dehydrogenase family)
MTENRVALVTGVSSGIGRSVAIALASRGFRTFGTVRETSDIGELPNNIELVRVDVRDESSVLRGVQQISEQTGRIDVLVNNAGYILLGALEETSTEEARQIFDTNFFGVLGMCQQVVPIMRHQRSGRILNISSVLGFLPAPYAGLYAATKHAIEAYSETLDHEVRQFGIRVSLVEPGFIRSKISQNHKAAKQTLAAYAKERTKAFDALESRGRNGDEPSSVASVVVDALSARNPRLRYPAGRGAKLLARLKRFAPSGLLDKGIRQQFGLDVA